MQKFTCFVKEEDGQYTSLCLELDVASCGNNKKEAIEGLRNAIAEYLEFMVSEGRENEIYRPVPMNELKNYLFPEDNTIEQFLEAISLEFGEENKYVMWKLLVTQLVFQKVVFQKVTELLS